MDFRNNNPGSVQYGNFINYYDFNSAEERVKLLPKDVWLPAAEHDSEEPYLLLDVGCNTGVLTKQLFRFLDSFCTRGRPVFILAVDIDGTLIERAQLLLEQDESFDILERIFFKYVRVDVLDTTNFDNIANTYLKSFERSKFDAICCFSITMWIHLNHGDDGLQRFLRKLTSLADLFVVEPQSWKCYQTAVKRLRKGGEEFPFYSKLQWRSDVEKEIQNFMEQELKMHKINECNPTNWKRRICFYRHSE